MVVGPGVPVLSRHAMNAWFAIFLKMPHRIFREDSCIQTPSHAADSKTGSKNRPSFHSGIAQPIRQTIARPKGAKYYLYLSGVKTGTFR